MLDAVQPVPVFDEPAYLMHTLNNIGLTQGFLKSIGCEWYMTSIGDIRDMGDDFRDAPGAGEKRIYKNPKTNTAFAWDELANNLKIYEEKIPYNQPSNMTNFLANYFKNELN